MYKNLLERLEISIIDFSQLNEEIRYEAEYFSKKTLHLFKVLRTKDTVLVGEMADVTDGLHTSIDYDNDSPINLLSATSPRENYFDLSRGAKISEKAHNLNPRTALRKNDVIISTVGTIGNCAVVDDSVLPANSDRHIGIIRINSTYSPYVLSTFLLSKYGRMQTNRETTGNVQQNLFLYKIREITIPNFTANLQHSIEYTVKKAQNDLQNAKGLYSSAESLLTHELGLDAWQPSRKQISVRSYQNIIKSGRIDAEYYQPKYDEIANKMKKIGNGYVETECNIFDKNVNPDKATEYKYIELANIGTSGEITGCTVNKGAELPMRARRIVHSGNIIISSIEGSLQSCALITDDYDGALCSTGFYVLDSDKINSETLLVLFKSAPIQALLKQQCTGTILTAFSKDGLQSIPIPAIKEGLQTTIQKNIQESFALRRHSSKLLEAAKHAVEIAIEQDEKTAMKYLSNVI